MVAKRLSMRKIREVLRLKHDFGLRNRDIGKSCSIGRTTVSDYLSRASAAGLEWPLLPGFDDAAVERLLFPPSPPTCPMIRVHLTLMLLWEEYKSESVYPEGYQYSHFCELYRSWRGLLKLWMRQDHRAGEKLFVDYAGQTMEVINPKTGEIYDAQIFVAVLGASNYTFSEATWTQSLPDWIGSHERAFSFFGGVPEPLILDYVPRNIIQIMGSVIFFV